MSYLQSGFTFPSQLCWFTRVIQLPPKTTPTKMHWYNCWKKNISWTTWLVSKPTLNWDISPVFQPRSSYINSISKSGISWIDFQEALRDPRKFLLPKYPRHFLFAVFRQKLVEKCLKFIEILSNSMLTTIDYTPNTNHTTAQLSQFVTVVVGRSGSLGRLPSKLPNCLIVGGLDVVMVRVPTASCYC